jgi:hypothetical protein
VPLSLLRASDPWYARTLGCSSESLGWPDLDASDIHVVAGDHFELFTRSGVASVAAALDRILKERSS